MSIGVFEDQRSNGSKWNKLTTSSIHVVGSAWVMAAGAEDSAVEVHGSGSLNQILTPAQALMGVEWGALRFVSTKEGRGRGASS